MEKDFTTSLHSSFGESVRDRWTLAGRKALITGATKGIGWAIAQEFLALGAEVIIVARNAEAIEQQIDAWQLAAGNAYGVAADVATSEGRRTVLESVSKTFGGLDILVNNVGTNIRKKVIDYTEEEFTSIFQTNLTSIFELSRLLYPLLKISEGSSIVNIGSVAGLISIWTGAPYGMTRAALVQLTRSLAVEWADEDNVLWLMEDFSRLGFD